MRRGSAALVAVFLGAMPVSARTITLTADDCDLMAVIAETQPRLSWAVMQMGPGVYDTYQQLQLYPNMAILMRFPLDKIPKGQRITKAEFSFPATYIAGAKPQLHVRRLLPEWGTGVCHDYRMVYPKKLAWDKAGARGLTSDRANRHSAVFKIDNVGVQTVDVTQDIELWYTGAVPNRGWFLSLEEGGLIYMTSPYPHGADWKLQITYEPQ